MVNAVTREDEELATPTRAKSQASVQAGSGKIARSLTSER